MNDQRTASGAIMRKIDPMQEYEHQQKLLHDFDDPSLLRSPNCIDLAAA